MEGPALLIWTALILGALHSFAPDHLATVSIFVSRRPSWRTALGLGARWGLGHSLTIVLAGGALVLTGLHVPARFGLLAERLVGVTLVVLGLVAMWRAIKLHGHWHMHDGQQHWHLHTHLKRPTHDHSHAALLGIGMLHGLAGTGALVVMVPVAVRGSAPRSVMFLVAFAVGTIASMALFGALAGHMFSVTARASARLHRVAVSLAGACSVLLGVWWIAAGGQ